jgi:CrcB protein
MQTPLAFLLVFLGGGFGSLLRFGIFLLLRPIDSKFPWATLLANALACFVLGVVIALHTSGQMTDRHRMLIGTGFCGGLSTFSTFIAENWGFWEAGQSGPVAVYVLLSLILCAACLFLGLKTVV